ncbi:MAG: hypothetical protein RL095_3370 [Verrucomicrobiota bacterium]
MKFQCVFCLSPYKVSTLDLGNQIDCPSCSRKVAVPRRSFDRGRVIDDFLIDRVIGSGGMGTVYLVKQISLDRPAALKVLARRFSGDPKFRQDFLAEARVVSGMIHQNLVQTYAFGEDDGDLYMAMEYVEGVSLGDRLENETRLSADEALDVIQQVAEGLHYAWNNAKMIHRDIKPDNILLMPDGTAKLTDMGLARRQEDLENVTEISGTPAYMNPEQFLRQPMDCRADIYSLGVCLYHAIMGRLPFDAGAVKELARQHIQDDVSFPDKTVDIVPEMKRLIKRMMMKDRNQRHSDYEELLQDIYNLRVKISGNRPVPGIHTVSINRRQFMGAELRRKNAASSGATGGHPAIQGPALDLPRRKVSSLAANTDRFPTSTPMESRRSLGLGALLLANIATFAAAAAAVYLAIKAERPASDYQRRAEALYASWKAGQQGTDLAAGEAKRLEESFPLNGAVGDHRSRAALLEIRLLASEASLRSAQLAAESLNKEQLLLLEERGKDIKTLSDELVSLRSEIEALRGASRLSATLGAQPSVDQTREEDADQAQALLWDDARAVRILWRDRLRSTAVTMIAEAGAGRLDGARTAADSLSKKMPGAYALEAASLTQACDDAGNFLVSLAEAVTPGLAITLNGKVRTIKSTYPATLELILDDGAVLRLREAPAADILGLFQRLAATSPEFRRQAACWAAFRAEFATARRLQPDNQAVDLLSIAWVESRIDELAKLARKDSRQAEILGARLLGAIRDSSETSELRSRISTLMGDAAIKGIK